VRALRFEGFGDPFVLQVGDVPNPIGGWDTAVIATSAASINPSDVGSVTRRFKQTRLLRTPGRDYSGTVIDGPPEWRNAEIWGSGGDVDFTRDGTHAERIIVPVASLRNKPSTLGHPQAAGRRTSPRDQRGGTLEPDTGRASRSKVKWLGTRTGRTRAVHSLPELDARAYRASRRRRGTQPQAGAVPCAATQAARVCNASARRSVIRPARSPLSPSCSAQHPANGVGSIAPPLVACTTRRWRSRR
jgi:hypothetical protein